MRTLTTGLYNRAAGAAGVAFMASIGSRFYDTEAPQDAVLPYVVYLVVSQVKDWQFVERFEDVLLQFSIFSTTSSSLEADDIYTLLVALFDEQYLDLAFGGYSYFIWMWRNTLTRMRDEITTLEGTVGAWHLAVDFDLYYEKD